MSRFPRRLLRLLLAGLIVGLLSSVALADGVVPIVDEAVASAQP